ncbi:MAG: hypothetical protein JXR81_00025 [Candidatus Goldbacteria bacterium]|nr:hypothetical protein [Candidatus Goldiibacteriota bacterium]
MYFYIKDRFEDRDWISTLVTLSKNELGEFKPKNKKNPKKSIAGFWPVFYTDKKC